MNISSAVQHAESGGSGPELAPPYGLADGHDIPAIGLGTAPMDDELAEVAVASALRNGYRLIDTGAAYGNERGVGRGIARSDTARDEITVITKLAGRDQGYDATLVAFEASRHRLGLDYVDCYLIHWPLPRVDRYVESWRAMIALQERGLVRSIGVSNFLPEHLRRLVDETGVLPAVNQVEMHPRFPQDELLAAHRELGVQTVSYSPLGRGSGLLTHPAVVSIAEARGVSPAQVVLRWHVGRKVVPIPRATGEAHQLANLHVFGFELTPDEAAAVSAAFAHRRVGFDPAVHEEF